MRRRAARTIVALRWVLVPLWIAGAALAFAYLPSIRQTQSAEVGALPLPEDAPALRAEILSKTDLPFPLVTHNAVVLHDEDGLAPQSLLEAAETARAAAQGRIRGLEGLAAVAPVPNVVLEPGARPTTILYYLYFRPGVGRVEGLDLAHRFADRHVAPQAGGPGAKPAGQDAYVGVTGTEPATEVRSNIIPERLPWVTGATALLVALAVDLHFRSPVAPFVSLATVGVAYLVASRVLGWFGQILGFAVPREVEPVAIVLLFGVVTDYSIFFLSRFRDRLREGLGDRDAAGRAAGQALRMTGLPPGSLRAASGEVGLAAGGTLRSYAGSSPEKRTAAQSWRRVR